MNSRCTSKIDSPHIGFFLLLCLELLGQRGFFNACAVTPAHFRDVYNKLFGSSIYLLFLTNAKHLAGDESPDDGKIV